jgi:hypothetical protein
MDVNRTAVSPPAKQTLFISVPMRVAIPVLMIIVKSFIPELVTISSFLKSNRGLGQGKFLGSPRPGVGANMHDV